MSRRRQAVQSRPVRLLLAVATALLVGVLAFLVTVNRTSLTAGNLASKSPPAATPPDASPTLTLDDRARNELAGTVTIEALGTSDEGLGTGWLLDAKGDFVTNAHVIQGQLTLRIRGRDGSSHVADVLGVDRNIDVAVVRSRDGFTATPLQVDGAPMGGLPKPVVVLASSHATGHADFTDETVTSIQADVPVTGDTLTGQPPVTTDYHDMLVLDGAMIYPGNSGGPVLDGAGHVVGILTLASKSSPEAYAIQVSRVLGELMGFAAR